ncbi:MAG: hypothetical protein WDM86_09130 [Rhizomicrobium sp.]
MCVYVNSQGIAGVRLEPTPEELRREREKREAETRASDEATKSYERTKAEATQLLKRIRREESERKAREASTAGASTRGAKPDCGSCPNRATTLAARIWSEPFGSGVMQYTLVVTIIGMILNATNHPLLAQIASWIGAHLKL